MPSIYKQYNILKCVWTWGEKRTGCRKKCRHRSRPPHGNSTCAYVTRACLGIGRLIEREALCSSSNKSNLGTRSKNTDADRDPYSHSHALMRQTLSVPPSLPPSGPSLVSCDGSDGVRYSLGWAGVEWSGLAAPDALARKEPFFARTNLGTGSFSAGDRPHVTDHEPSVGPTHFSGLAVGSV